jgi:hypothetical protein
MLRVLRRLEVKTRMPTTAILRDAKMIARRLLYPVAPQLQLDAEHEEYSKHRGAR